MPHSLRNVGLQCVIRASDSSLEWKNISEPRIRWRSKRITFPASRALQLITIGRIGIEHVRRMGPNVFEGEQKIPAKLLVNPQAPLIEHWEFLVLTLKRSKARLRDAIRPRVWGSARKRSIREPRLECLIRRYRCVNHAVWHAGGKGISAHRPENTPLEKHIRRRILVKITRQESHDRIGKDSCPDPQYGLGPYLPCDCGSRLPDDQRRIREHIVLIPQNCFI